MQKKKFINGLQIVFSQGVGIVPILCFVYYGDKPILLILTGLLSVAGASAINYFGFSYFTRKELLVLIVTWGALLFGIIPVSELIIYRVLAVTWLGYVFSRGTGNFSRRGDIVWFLGLVLGFGILGFTVFFIDRFLYITAGMLMLFSSLVMIGYSFILGKGKY